MREVYMMAALNLQTARDKHLPPINNPNKTDFKVGDITLLKTTSQQQPLTLNTS